MTHLHKPKTVSNIFTLMWSICQSNNSGFICCLYLVNIWLKFGSYNHLATLFFDPYSNFITAASYIWMFYSSMWLCFKLKHDFFTPTYILSFHKEKNKVILHGHIVSLRFHSSASCDGRLIGYQIPLDLPPGGARILAEDLFGMLSSIWAPGETGRVNVWLK